MNLASVVRRQAFELLHGEDGALFAQVEGADVAAAALPYPGPLFSITFQLRSLNFLSMPGQLPSNRPAERQAA
jgi:hypothetical protein